MIADGACIWVGSMSRLRCCSMQASQADAVSGAANQSDKIRTSLERMAGIGCRAEKATFPAKLEKVSDGARLDKSKTPPRKRHV